MGTAMKTKLLFAQAILFLFLFPAVPYYAVTTESLVFAAGSLAFLVVYFCIWLSRVFKAVGGAAPAFPDF